MVGNLLVGGLVALLTLPNTHRVLPHFQLVHLDVEFSGQRSSRRIAERTSNAAKTVGRSVCIVNITGSTSMIARRQRLVEMKILAGHAKEFIANDLRRRPQDAQAQERRHGCPAAITIRSLRV